MGARRPSPAKLWHLRGFDSGCQYPAFPKSVPEQKSILEQRENTTISLDPPEAEGATQRTRVESDTEQMPTGVLTEH